MSSPGVTDPQAASCDCVHLIKGLVHVFVSNQCLMSRSEVYRHDLRPPAFRLPRRAFALANALASALTCALAAC